MRILYAAIFLLIANSVAFSSQCFNNLEQKLLVEIESNRLIEFDQVYVNGFNARYECMAAEQLLMCDTRIVDGKKEELSGGNFWYLLLNVHVGYAILSTVKSGTIEPETSIPLSPCDK